MRIDVIRYAENCTEEKPAYICRLAGEKRWRVVHGMGALNYPWITYKGEKVRFMDMDPWVGNSPDMWREWKVFEEPVLWKQGRPLYREDLERMRFRLYPYEVDAVKRAGFHLYDEDGEGLYMVEALPE